jgi:hypothetical protein
MAKTYLQIHPNGNLLVVDRAKSIGGSWAKERLYAGLKTNNIFGSYEFGDFPMIPERYAATPDGHIPGEIVHAYFCDVAAHYGIDSRLRLETKVQSAALREDGLWSIKMVSIKELEESGTTIVAAKLVIATGLTSEPYIPVFPGQENFGALILHSKELRKQADNLASRKNVVVLGGNKSAWDVCYSAARSGSRVHMVIRPSGGGPSYVWPKSFSWGPFNLSLALMSATRLFIAFDPTPYGKKGPLAFLMYFLHRTVFGQKLCQFFWNQLDSHIKKLNGYNTHTELQKLEPWTTPFWMGNSLSIHNYDTNWFDLVREGRLSIHIADLTSLSKNRVHLSTGGTLEADALVCCTGWKADPTVHIDLPCLTNESGSREKLAETLAVEREVNRDIFYLPKLPRRTTNAPKTCGLNSQQNFPLYQLQPSFPHQLYRMVIPSGRVCLEKKNLAFIGLHSSVHAVVVAQAQALWIAAFFQDKVKHLSPEEIDLVAVEHSSMLDSVYGKLRRPRETGGAAGRHPDLVFDSLPYADTLLKDLGLIAKRKSNWWKEIFEIYRPRDYRHIIEEWRAKN